MAGNSKIVSAYYSFDPSGLAPEAINGDILTHLIVGWAGVNASTGICYPSSSADVAAFRRCTDLRKRFPHLKISLVCGDGSGNFSPVANNASLRSSFVKSAIALLEECAFDGLDIDWEFPVFRSRKCDRQNFILLLQELRTAFDAHSPRYLLTIAGAAQKLVAQPAYDIPAIAPLLDFVNLMCYDYNMFTYYNVWASHNSPLFRKPDQKAIFATLNTVWSADYWVNEGMPREKVIVGIPTYARPWKLMFPCWHGYNAPCVSSFSGGATSYPEVRDLLASGARRVFDNQANVPYAYSGRQWVSYEDEESITVKAEWIRKQGFGGAMVFSLNQDDWKGVFSSNGTPFPLLETVYRIVTASGSRKTSPVDETAKLLAVNNHN